MRTFAKLAFDMFTNRSTELRPTKALWSPGPTEADQTVSVTASFQRELALDPDESFVVLMSSPLRSCRLRASTGTQAGFSAHLGELRLRGKCPS
jgi:hypothetical protein